MQFLEEKGTRMKNELISIHSDLVTSCRTDWHTILILIR